MLRDKFLKTVVYESRGSCWNLSFSEGDCTILLAQTATAHTSPDLLLSVVDFTIIVYAEYSYAQK